MAQSQNGINTAVTLTAEQAIAEAKRLANAIQGTGNSINATNRELAKSEKASRNAGNGMLMLAYAADDMQYGMRGIMNNVPGLVMAMGGSAGMAGAVSILTLAFKQLYDNLDKIVPMFDSALQASNRFTEGVKRRNELQAGDIAKVDKSSADAIAAKKKELAMNDELAEKEIAQLKENAAMLDKVLETKKRTAELRFEGIADPVEKVKARERMELSELKSSEERKRRLLFDQAAIADREMKEVMDAENERQAKQAASQANRQAREAELSKKLSPWRKDVTMDTLKRDDPKYQELLKEAAILRDMEPLLKEHMKLKQQKIDLLYEEVRKNEEMGDPQRKAEKELILTKAQIEAAKAKKEAVEKTDPWWEKESMSMRRSSYGGGRGRGGSDDEEDAPRVSRRPRPQGIEANALALKERLEREAESRAARMNWQDSDRQSRMNQGGRLKDALKFPMLDAMKAAQARPMGEGPKTGKERVQDASAQTLAAMAKALPGIAAALKSIDGRLRAQPLNKGGVN